VRADHPSETAGRGLPALPTAKKAPARFRGRFKLVIENDSLAMALSWWWWSFPRA
jgi:hypothetical protein